MLIAGSIEGGETYRTERQNRNNSVEWTTALVNVGEDLRRVTGFGERSEDARSGVDAGETDRENAEEGRM